MRQKDYLAALSICPSYFASDTKHLFITLNKLFFSVFFVLVLYPLNAIAQASVTGSEQTLNTDTSNADTTNFDTTSIDTTNFDNTQAELQAAASASVSSTAGTTLTVNQANTRDKTASLLFANLREQVYQIRVIDIASGDKFTIGSGFQISSEGHIATNFHVVSSFVHEPEKYRLEFASFDESVASAELLAVDVVHDLAILKASGLSEIFLPLKSAELKQGDRIYSMGNPRDLGMTIIEGTYNGFVQTSRYQKILFSGSLNSGMSGGPTVDANGEVVGINVSKGGEQLSFLVPVEKLASLIVNLPDQIAQRQAHNQASVDQASADQTGVNQSPSLSEQSDKSKDSEEAGEFDIIIRDALLADQAAFYSRLLEQDVELEALGELMLPAKLSDSLKCWGHTVDQKDDNKYASVHQHCRSEDQIYIKDSFYVGDFFYDYEWISSTELNQLQFYNLLQSRFNHSSLRNVYDKEHVTNYQCQTNFVTLAGHSFKVSSCFRAYKRYLGLYDALLLMASVDEKDKAALITMGASGVDRNNAVALFKRMMESVQWNR